MLVILKLNCFLHMLTPNLLRWKILQNLVNHKVMTWPSKRFIFLLKFSHFYVAN